MSKPAIGVACFDSPGEVNGDIVARSAYELGMLLTEAQCYLMTLHDVDTPVMRSFLQGVEEYSETTIGFMQSRTICTDQMKRMVTPIIMQQPTHSLILSSDSLIAIGSLAWQNLMMHCKRNQHVVMLHTGGYDSHGKEHNIEVVKTASEAAEAVIKWNT